MAGVFLRAFCVVLAISAAVSLPGSGAHKSKDKRCPTGFVNLGDSLTDTGNTLDAFPFYTDPENYPYGETFFGAPAKRFSNGRLVPDFTSLAFDVPLLDGYFATTAFDYRHGVNFAVGGATATIDPTAVTPFSLTFQVAQFIRLKNSVKATTSNFGCRNFRPNLPQPNAYSEWLYTLEFGGNDILNALQRNMTVPQIISDVMPAAFQNISAAVKLLYKQSARNFLVFGVPAQGCSTIILTLYGNLGLPTDSLGCIISVNQLIVAFNGGVLQAIQGLRKSLPDATIAYFDYYNANLEILQHPVTYGFNPNLTLSACCGAPGVGTLNYNPIVTCGHPALGSNVCANPEEYVIWDGVHFTEHFYRTITTFVLSARFTDRGHNYTALCDLDFSRFGPQETYANVYDHQCNDEFS